MTVEVGFFSDHPGCYLGNIRVFPYNRYDAISSHLQSMLLAPSVGRWIAAGLLLVVWNSVVCSWFQLLEAWSEMTVMTCCPGRNMVCFCVYQNVLISTFIDFVCRPVWLGGFLFSLGDFYVRLHCGVVSVFDLYLVSFSYFWSGTGTTDFLGCLTIIAFNPLNARKYLSSWELYNLSNWL